MIYHLPTNPRFRKATLLQLVFASFLLLLATVSSTHAQVTLTAGPGLTYSQNFDGMGAALAANLPTGWQWQPGTGPVYSSTPATANVKISLVAGTTTPGTVFNSSSAGTIYNMASGPSGAATTDRAVGFLSSGSYPSPQGPVSMMVKFLNSTGSTMNGATVAFDYEKYRTGTRAFDWTFFYSTDGSTWTAIPAGNQSYAADGANAVLNPSTSISKTGINITGFTVPNGGNFYLRFNYAGVGGTTNAQALAIDNFTITAAVSSGCTPPAQVSTFTAPAATTSSIDLAWSTPANNVLIIRHQGSAPVNAPVSGTVYTAGTSLGNGDTVAYAGSASGATIGSLIPGSTYFFKSYSFDPTGSAGSTPCYNTAAPAAVSAVTVACLGTQVSGLSASNIQGSSLSLGMTIPSGAQVIILQKAAATPITEVPAAGAVYSVGAAIGTATVAYVGAATTAPVSDLGTNTQYQFAAFAYDPTGYNNSPCYLIPAATATATTQPCNSTAQITNLSTGTPTNYSVPLSWDAPAIQVLVLKRQGSPVVGVPVSGTAYTAGNTISGDTVVYVGSAAGAAATGLLPGSSNYFKAYAFDPTGFTGSTPCYNTISAPSAGPLVAGVCTGGSQVSNLTLGNVQGSKLDLSWTLPAGTNIIILKKRGLNEIQAPIVATVFPVTGHTYNVGDQMGISVDSMVTVAYTGSASAATITGLNTLSHYRFEAFAYDPTGYNGMPCYNIITTHPGINTSTGICDGGQQLAAITATNATTSSINISWPAPADHVIILRHGGSGSTAPSVGVTYNVGDMANGAVVIYTGTAAGAFTDTGLAGGTPYVYDAYAFDPTGYTGGTPCYNFYNAPEATLATTSCVSGQVTSLVASNPTTASIDLHWSVPTGENVIIEMHENNFLSGFPASGTIYTVGQMIAPNTVAYIGTGTGTTITGLNPGVSYVFAAFAFDPTAYTNGTPCYMLDNYAFVIKATAACTAPATAATGLNFSGTGSNTFTANWTNGTGSKHIVLLNTANSFTAPANGADPVANSNYSGAGQQVIYNGTGNTTTVTGLNPNTTYYIAVYEGNCTGTNTHYNATALTGSQATVGSPIATAAITGTSFCAGTAVGVLFTATGTFNAGNTFTAELSDASGSFVSPTVIGTLNDITSGAISATIPVSTAIGAGYRIRVSSSNPQAVGTDNGTNLSIITDGNMIMTQTVAGSTAYNDACNTVVTITPAGAAPVTGSVTVGVSFDASVQQYNGTAYLQRHYDITPAANANTATANITLYYTQDEFNVYNAANGTDPDLPTGPADNTGIGNFRITQYHGTSAGSTPGTYSGWGGNGPASVLIVPTSVIWNSTTSHWEVTFPITGFSGFFATGGIPTPLPLTLLSFTASKEAAGRNLLNWQTALEPAGTSFTIQRCSDGISFDAIGTTAGKGNNAAYSFNDDHAPAGKNYYRLKITEATGQVTYSNTVLVNNTGNSGNVTVSPVPASRSIVIANTDASLNGQQATILDMTGHQVYRFILSAATTVDISNWPAGVYSLRLPAGNVVRIVKQ